MSVWSYFIPRFVLQSHSSYNDEILVVEKEGEFNLLVGGSFQSGKYMRGIWKKTFDTFQLKNLSVSSILVLGVGGGTAIKLFQTLFPQTQIDAVEIDNTILTIADSYFDLKESETLHLIEGDAKKFLTRSKKKYDLVLVDIFSGPDVPEFVQKREFFSDIADHLSVSGTVLFNFLRDHGYEGKIEGMRRIMNQVFLNTREYPIKHNLFFLAKKNYS